MDQGTHGCVSVCVCVCVPVCVCMLSHVRLCTCRLWMRSVCIRTCIHACMHACTQISIHRKTLSITNKQTYVHTGRLVTLEHLHTYYVYETHIFVIYLCVYMFISTQPTGGAQNQKDTIHVDLLLGSQHVLQLMLGLHCFLGGTSDSFTLS